MSINKCDKIVEKSIINWIFVVILLSQQSSYIHAEPDSEPIPLVRLPSNTLLKYTAYKDVSILHFVVPSDTRTAFFNFKAYEETKSAFLRQCKPRDVTLHLKAGSYPVISPENITFPKHFLHADQRFEIYNLQFKSDGSMRRLTIDGPNTGDWYAVAFISWTDPSNDRIEQQGLAASCETLLLSEMSVVSVKPIILNADNGLMYNNTLYVITDDRNANNNSKSGHHNNSSSSSNSTTSSDNSTSTMSTSANASTDASADKSKSSNHRPIIYKFFVPRNVDVTTVTFNVMRACDQCQPIEVRVQANGVPTTKHHIHSIVISSDRSSENRFDFYPHQNVWHYIEIGFENSLSNDSTDSDATVSLNAPSIGGGKAFKTKARLDKRMRFMENNIFVNFSIGLEFIHEMPVAVESTENGANEKNKSTAANVNSRKDDSQNDNTNMVDGKTGSANRTTVNTSNVDSASSSSVIDQSSSQSKTSTTTTTSSTSTPTTMDESNDSDYVDTDEIDENGNVNTASAKLSAKPRKIHYYSLLRQTYREFFMFDYDLIPLDNGSVPTYINLTSSTPSGFRFDVGNVFDIGGTLSFAIVMDNLHDATLAAAASAANIVKERNRMSNDGGVAVAEKLVHINNDELNDAPSHELGEGKMSSSSSNAKSNMNFDLNQSHENDDTGYANSSGSNQTIIICMHLNAAALPKWPNQCVYNRHVFPAASIMNNTNEDTSTGLVHVAFPEPGTWYITLGLFCHGAETSRITIIDSVKEFIKKYVDLLHDVRVPCACANRTDYYQKCVNNARCLSDLSESETLKVKECLMDSKCTSKHKEMARKFELHHRYATEQPLLATNSNACNASAVFTISSSPCVAGRCGKFGRCYHYMSGGFVFSTCLCIKNYRGWDCTEDSQVPSSLSILLALLLLTLSNLLFIPSIYIAVRRKYFTEGIIYFFAMFFSIFYHACDSGEDEYSFCLVKIGVLQFCDFYCGLLAIWVTLIAMAHIRQSFVSMLHMFGAILLAFGTELNKQSLWVFLAPALTGLCLISVSWGWRCQRTRKMFPGRRYLSLFLPLGMVFVMCGLVCYAFLQTRHNYFIVHSAWHMLMALSILLLLPNRNSFLPKC